MYVVVGLVVLGLGIGVGLYGYGKIRRSDDRFVEIDVPAGATARELGDLLSTHGLVESAFFASLYLGASIDLGDVAPGPHLLDGRASLSELSSFLTRAEGRPKGKLVIPEGFSMFQIAERVESLGIASRASFLRACQNPELLESLKLPQGSMSAEGYLFPATYMLPLDSPASALVTRFVRESDLRWKRLSAENPEALATLGAGLGWGRREITTLASLVEKEAAVDEERPKVASVFLNRLTDASFSPKRLESDPSSAYGCLAVDRALPSCAGFDGKVTPAMNRDRDNRYSTYTHEGLPPGPIANPGERAIQAVLVPDKTRYFFFVADGHRRHKFSETLAEHERAIRGQ